MYQKQEHFRFLEGHRSMIFSMQSQIFRLKDAEKDDPVKQPRVRVSQARSQQAKKYSDKEVKEKLICQLNSYAKNLDYELPPGIISEKNVLNFAQRKHAVRSTHRGKSRYR